MYRPARAKLSKTGRAKFISHLDLYRTVSRAITRSKIPVWYTEGFNPHPFVTFLLPLSLGIESECEFMDYKIDDSMTFDDAGMLLSEALPEGLEVTDVYEPVMKAKDIASARYTMEMRFEGKTGDETAKIVREIAGRSEIFVQKRSKSGEKTVNLKEIARLEQAEFEVLKDNAVMSITLPAGNAENVNPQLISGAFEKEFAQDFSYLKITRKAVYNGSGEMFV